MSAAGFSYARTRALTVSSCATATTTTRLATAQLKSKAQNVRTYLSKGSPSVHSTMSRHVIARAMATSPAETLLSFAWS